jgi:hypothetical protein
VCAFLDDGEDESDINTNDDEEEEIDENANDDGECIVV